MIETFSYSKTEDSIKKVDISDINELKDHTFWVDMTGVTKSEADIIRKTFGLHPLTIEDIVAHNTRIKVEEFDKYLFCVFYGVRKKKIFELAEIDFVIGKDFVISSHRGELLPTSELKGNPEKLGSLMKKGVDFVFHRIIDKEVDEFFPLFDSLQAEVEKVENEAIINAKPEILRNILKIKRSLMKVKKVCTHQRDKLSFLAKDEYKFVSKKARIYFRDVYDHSIRVSDSLDTNREAIANAFDVYMSTISNSMNEVMKVLSIFATIALPLTVISGVYGTNFVVLPGSGSAYGFWVMILIMIALSVSMLLFFRKRKWL